jgi:hypothetical protein
MDYPHNPIIKLLHGVARMGMILSLWFGTGGAPGVQARGVWNGMPADNAIALETPFTLDGVLVSVRAASLPSVDFVVSEPGSASQVATSLAWKPFREFTVTAIPFGSKPPTEALPVAGPGLKPDYDNILRNYRLQQGGIVQDGPSVAIFDQQVTGLQTLVNLFIDGAVPKPVLISEWVVEAGDRLWIIRWSEEQSSSDFSIQSENFPGDLVLSSSSLNNASTVTEQPQNNPAIELNQDILAADLPTPSWWSGDCDNNNYQNSIQNPDRIDSYPLGAVYLGLPACGPRPYYDNAPDVTVNFFPGSWGVYEWECVELSMRFLYLMYGIAPYQANGSQVVWNYSGSLLVKIPNSTAGQAPQPNDVLSYGSTSTSGHTSVVTASDVNGNGNGTVTVIEENAAVSGSSTLTVTNWSVAGDAGTVSGWLHSTLFPGPFNKSSPVNGATNQLANPILDWGDSTNFESYEYCLNTTASCTAPSTWTSTGTRSSVALSVLAPGTYHWQARARNAIGTTYANGSDTSWWSFSIPASGNQTLTVSKSGTGSGTLTSNPAGISCGTTCSYAFAYNTSVTLTPAASAGSIFTGWGGACSGNGNCRVTMTEARSVTASFTLAPYHAYLPLVIR